MDDYNPANKHLTLKPVNTARTLSPVDLIAPGVFDETFRQMKRKIRLINDCIELHPSSQTLNKSWIDSLMTTIESRAGILTTIFSPIYRYYLTTNTANDRLRDHLYVDYNDRIRDIRNKNQFSAGLDIRLQLEQQSMNAANFLSFYGLGFVLSEIALFKYRTRCYNKLWASYDAIQYGVQYFWKYVRSGGRITPTLKSDTYQLYDFYRSIDSKSALNVKRSVFRLINRPMLYLRCPQYAVVSLGVGFVVGCYFDAIFNRVALRDWDNFYDVGAKNKINGHEVVLSRLYLEQYLNKVIYEKYREEEMAAKRLT